MVRVPKIDGVSAAPRRVLACSPSTASRSLPVDDKVEASLDPIRHDWRTHIAGELVI